MLAETTTIAAPVSSANSAKPVRNVACDVLIAIEDGRLAWSRSDVATAIRELTEQARRRSNAVHVPEPIVTG
jgi:hypothetical protein